MVICFPVFADEDPISDVMKDIGEAIPGIEMGKLEIDALGIEEKAKALGDIKKAALTAGIDSEKLLDLVFPRRFGGRHPDGAERDRRERLPEGDGNGPGLGGLFPPGEITKTEIPLDDFCYRVVPYSKNFLLRLPKGPGKYDMIVYPVIYSKVTSVEYIWFSNRQGKIVLDKTLSKQVPHIEWIMISERFGNEFEVAKAAESYIALLSLRACK